ncbi:hypothetical protein MMSR116_12745 [Methylobacterium mesophilicum SR1.6/6]|uniref:Uncharacterized protein n=1 Tax=Methylobacterium mesophilicum SR1.6/6 TaxID=908290 RepID=A0A6B9FJU9_9HYPH|nr:hypothetical protein [Methylobacterium mesophilicum]QGY02647.1 hypothetical protein MMSR116_12745 [Methylobacterium mesophilicum SR1.6/6]
MARIPAAILAGLTGLVLNTETPLAADPPYYGPSARGSVGAPLHQGRGAVGFVPGRPRYSYYGEYQYPVPFGYGYAYAPVVRPGFEYGYNGPRYIWSAPDWYYGPAFGYSVW